MLKNTWTLGHHRLIIFQHFWWVFRNRAAHSQIAKPKFSAISRRDVPGLALPKPCSSARTPSRHRSVRFSENLLSRLLPRLSRKANAGGSSKSPGHRGTRTHRLSHILECPARIVDRNLWYPKDPRYLQLLIGLYSPHTYGAPGINPRADQPLLAQPMHRRPQHNCSSIRLRLLVKKQA